MRNFQKVCNFCNNLEILILAVGLNTFNFMYDLASVVSAFTLYAQCIYNLSSEYIMSFEQQI